MFLFSMCAILTARSEKCEWGEAQLGHFVGRARVAIPKDREAAMLNYVRPTKQKSS